MQLIPGQFYKLGYSSLVGYYFTDPYGTFPRHHRLPRGTILYLQEIKWFRRPCGNGNYGRFTLEHGGKEVSLYIRVSKKGRAAVVTDKAHPLELLADAAE